MLNSVTCSVCGEDVDFEDDVKDGVGSAECMPDGVILPSGAWVCSDCMVDDEGNVKPEYD